MTDEIYFEEIPSNDPRLGRHVLHDERSRAFAYDPRGVTPVSIRHQRFIDVLNQGEVGSCTGNSGLGCLGTFPFYPTVVSKITDWSQATAVDFYSAATAIDPFVGTYLPDDTGSNGLSIAKVLKTRGLISGYQHTFSFSSLLSALTTRPVITGTNWYSSFYYPNSDGIVTIGPGATIEGGHEYVLDELDMERQLIGATNSWGNVYGKSGRFYIPFDVMKRLLSEKGDVTVFNPITSPAPLPVSPTIVTEPASTADTELWGVVKNSVKYSKSVNSKAIKKWAATKGLT